ncbi:MAG: hypothetical protein M1170_01865 [Patescibacteria group bacterium]|nr:hypothetical protein [Patescibacteria group bacterium]
MRTTGNNRGTAALPAMLFIGGIIVEIALAGAFISYYLSQSGFGVKISAEALAAAEAGVQDALIRIIRDKNFSSAGYNLTVGNRSANIIVCKDSCAGTGKHKITSTGTAMLKRRKIEAVANVDSVTGEVKIESVQEAAI